MPNQISEANDLKEYLSAELAQREKNERLEYAMKNRGMNRAVEYEADSAKADIEWKKLFETVANLKAEWGRGYNNDWITSTYAILAIIEQFTMAMHASKPFSSLLSLLTNPASDMVVSWINEKRYTYPLDIVLPKLMCHAEFSDDHQLKISNLAEMKRSDGRPMFPKQENQAAQEILNRLEQKLEDKLKEGVTAWLDSLNYVRNPASEHKFVHKENHTPLLKEEFERLRDSRDNPDKSFEAFLSGRLKIDFQLTPSPASPRP